MSFDTYLRLVEIGFTFIGSVIGSYLTIRIRLAKIETDIEWLKRSGHQHESGNRPRRVAD